MIRIVVDSKENFKFDLGVKGLMRDTGVLIFKEILGWTHTCVFKGKRFCQCGENLCLFLTLMFQRGVLYL